MTHHDVLNVKICFTTGVGFVIGSDYCDRGI